MRAPALLLASILLIAGCTPMQSRDTSLEAGLAEARALLEKGDHAAAVERYAQLARAAEQPQRDRIQLLALEAALVPELAELARQYLSVLDDRWLNEEERARKRLARARLALMDNRPGEALDALNWPLDSLAPALRARFLELRAEALLRQERILEAARDLLALEALIDDPGRRSEIRNRLWNTLIQASALDLHAWLSQTADPTLRGWLALAWIYNGTPIQGGNLAPRLDEWSQQYPSHPAAALLDHLRALWAEMQHYPTHIAVLLPLSGKLAPVGQAVADGILAAFYALADRMEEPELRFYDTAAGAETPGELYDRAVREGAEFVLGPLRKQSVEALVTGTSISVPVLTLNRVGEEINPGPAVYQFGLAPEDEAWQVAERASIEGREFAIAFVPDNAWGQRIESSFRERFEQLAGQVLSSERLDPATADYGQPIMRSLGIDQSRLRHRQVQATIGRSVHFEPRRRQDVEFFFVAAPPRQARLLKPQLEYHRAGDVPVYATSLIYSGRPDPVSDRDLDGVLFCDMPWLFPSNPEQELKGRLERLDLPSARRLPRLVALGIDGFRIIPYLERLAANPSERYEGVTGSLRIDENRRIHRRLVWARFEKGHAIPLSQARERHGKQHDEGTSGQGSGG